MPKRTKPTFKDGTPKPLNPVTNDLWKFGEEDKMTGLIFHRYSARENINSPIKWISKERYSELLQYSENLKKENRVKSINPRTGKPWVVGEFNPENGKYFRQYNPRTKSGVVWTSSSGLVKAKDYKKRYLKENPDKVKEWLLANRKNRLLTYKRSYQKHKESRRNYARDYSRKFREKCQLLQRKWREENPDKLSRQNKRATVKRKKEATKELNIFYRKMKIPKYLWHEGEFADEKDFQIALEHVLAKKYNLYVEHEFHHEEGRTDIYLFELSLLIEVKLHSSMWSEDSVREQLNRYSKIARTLVVSIDGKPEGWHTPQGLFSILEIELNEMHKQDSL